VRWLPLYFTVINQSSRTCSYQFLSAHNTYVKAIETTGQLENTSTTTDKYYRMMLPTRPTCSTLPHGFYSLGITLLAVLGWFFSLFQDGCDYAKVSGPILQQLASSRFVPWLEFGMGAFREPVLQTDGTFQTTLHENSCTLYADEFIDGAWRTAQTFSFLALAIGGAASLFLMFTTCFVVSRETWRWIGYELLVASFLQTFSFCWFATGVCSWNTCEMYWGSIADIIACTFWYLAGIGVIYKYPTPIRPVEPISTCAKAFLEHDRGQDLQEEQPASTITDQFEDENEKENDITDHHHQPPPPTPPPQQTSHISDSQRNGDEDEDEDEDEDGMEAWSDDGSESDDGSSASSSSSSSSSGDDSEDDEDGDDSDPEDESHIDSKIA
jgi:hypothetical protein